MKFLLHQFCNKMVTALVVKHKKHLNKILTINIFFWKMKLLSEEVIENKVSEIQFWSLSVSPCLSLCLCLFLSLCLTLSLYSHPSPPPSRHIPISVISFLTSLSPLSPFSPHLSLHPSLYSPTFLLFFSYITLSLLSPFTMTPPRSHPSIPSLSTLITSSLSS